MGTRPDPTVDQFCEEFNCSKPSAYKLLNDGEIYGYKIGRGTRIVRASADAYKKSHSYLDGKSAAPKRHSAA